MNIYDIDNKTKMIAYLILYECFIVLVFTVLSPNTDNLLVMSVLLGIFFCLSIFRHLFIRISIIKYSFPILEILLIFLVHYFDMTNRSQLLFTILMADIIIEYAFIYSITYSVMGYIVILLIQILKSQNWTDDTLSEFVLANVVSNALVLVTFLILKKMILKNIQFKRLMEKLIEKTNEAEELAVFKERSRIAGEIHDTVGHTLTTVLIEIEAGKMLIDKNPELAKEKITIAKEQVKKGLNDIRDSVKCIKSGEQILDFEDSLKALFKEHRKMTGIEVNFNMKIQSELMPVQEKILYRVIQEALTNGLKHGNATRTEINILEEDDKLLVLISDNGCGTDQIVEGFGLTNMIERIHSIGGQIEFHSKLYKGFTISIVLPVGK